VIQGSYQGRGVGSGREGRVPARREWGLHTRRRGWEFGIGRGRVL
jgi:hypothetical protein